MPAVRITLERFLNQQRMGERIQSINGWSIRSFQWRFRLSWAAMEGSAKQRSWLNSP